MSDDLLKKGILSDRTYNLLKDILTNPDTTAKDFNSLLSFEIQKLIKQNVHDTSPTRTVDIENETVKRWAQNNLTTIVGHGVIDKIIDSTSREEVKFSREEFQKGSIIAVIKTYSHACPICSESLYYNISTNHVSTEPHDCVEYKDIKLKFKVPKNGKIVAADWLGNILKDKENPTTLNSFKGRVESTLNAESQGFLHFYVGNTCPRIYKLQNGDFLVASFWAMHDDDEVLKSEYEGAVEVAYICTDMWWVTISTMDNCKKKQKSGSKFRGGDEYQMDAGNWECEVYETNSHDTGIYARLTKV